MRDKAFGEWLVGERILRPEGLRQALEIQTSLQTRLDTIILDLALVPEPTLLEALGRFHNTRTVSRAQLSAVSQTIARLISPRIASRLQVIPFQLEGKTLSIAALEPGDLLVEDELSLITGCMVERPPQSRLYGLRDPCQIQLPPITWPQQRRHRRGWTVAHRAVLHATSFWR
jgi:type IV pilus assembly protein PilB